MAIPIGAAAVTYPVPSAVPAGAAELDSMPLGLSFEFFMWPSYMTNITPPLRCMEHFKDLYGKAMPIRIGGTTQDRATYDPNLEAYVSYSVDDPLEAPMTLTYGPRFFDLIRFNRGDNNRTNTFEAIMAAKQRALDYLWAIEIGNEPDLYHLFWNKPVAVAPWNETQEGQDAADWIQQFIDTWGEPLPMISAGAYGIPYEYQPSWPNTDYLINEAFNDTVKSAVGRYCTHLYALAAGTSLEADMAHTQTVSDVSLLVEKIAAAKSVNRPYILGETGFHGQDVATDATFGGALQILDKTLRATSIGIERLFYHQGTINQAYFNWWSDNQVNAPFYGGYMATLALAGGDHVIATDAGNDSYAQYVVYKDGRPWKAVLINTEYYSGSGTRSSCSFTLSGLSSQNVKALRMTAASSVVTTSRDATDTSLGPTIGGQSFSHQTCAKEGKLQYETACVKRGKVTFRIAASEALLVYL
ncbi:hypothetical protein NEMBOFW57_008068 [Staphylotrichum longicolle]|uniref:Beta-glucuronidase C-terminal domain-containing protein n=1 Tax=Staphylotrichum longicolle TaxID=669026 RepID=A0AAD4ER34_9PEZI|nr:hypothetical protein NEMBOFW57_008068 [Staphylotrichum longicolle]